MFYFFQNEKKLFSFVAVGILSVGLIGVGAFFLLTGTGPVQAETDQMCQVPADVVLVMDRSGSMDDGGSPSKCEWKELEEVGDSNQCVNKSEEGLTESECLSKPSCLSNDPQFTPAQNNKLEDAQEAANSFLDNFGATDQSSLVSFSDSADLEKQLSDDHSSTKSKLGKLSAKGATNIGGAIEKASGELASPRANPQANQALVLLTDGKANKPTGPGHGEHPDDVQFAKDKAQEAADKGFKIFTIGLGKDGEDINTDMLQDIAEIGSGEFHHAQNGDELESIYQNISQEVCEFGSIAGCKYKDLNNNGSIDNSEPTIADWTVKLSTPGSTTLSQTTDQDGCYLFSGLEAGDYTVKEGANSDMTPFTQTVPGTTSPNYHISIPQSTNESELTFTGKDFANYFPVCGNGIIDESQGEQCDDGNTENGDGCSSQCLIEEEDPPQEPVSGTTTPSSAGDVVINEIMQNPDAVSDFQGEWFEIYNPTQNLMELQGCTVSDNGGDSFDIDESLVISPDGFGVLAKNDDSSKNGGLVPDFVFQKMILSNSGDEIVLTCDSTEIDRVEYDTTSGGEFPEDPEGASMAFAPSLLNSSSPEVLNDDGANWCESSSSFGDGDLGTPGTQNDACAGISQPAVEFAGCKFEDANNNGVVDSSEPALGNWQISLEQQSGSNWSPVASTTTASSSGGSPALGCYRFSGLEAGTYRLSETLQSDWNQTFPNTSSTSYNSTSSPISLSSNASSTSYIIEAEAGDSFKDLNFANFQTSSEEPSPSDFTDESSCEEAGFSWWNGTCHADDPSDASDLDNQSDCEAFSFFWYNNTCNSSPQQNGGGGGDEPTPSPMESGDLVINEVMQNPDSVSDAKGEWFEIFNPTEEDLNIQGCVVSDNSGDSHQISSSVTVPGRDYAVLGVNDNSDENGGVNLDYVYDSFLLSNSGDEIVLTCDSTEIDRVEYDGGPDFPDPTGASMILRAPHLGNNNGDNWCTSSSRIQSQSDLDFATPGALNDPCDDEVQLLGCKFHDADSSGSIEESESALSGWGISLEKDTEKGWETVGTTTTTSANANKGCYTFDGFSLDKYRLSETLQSDWNQTFPNTSSSPYNSTSSPISLQSNSTSTSYIINASSSQTFSELDFANSEEPAGPSDFTDESSCEEAGFSWWNDTCHENDPETAGDLDNQTDCEAFSFYWYDEACHTEPQSSGSNGNGSDDQQTSSGGGGGGGGGSSSSFFDEDEDEDESSGSTGEPLVISNVEIASTQSDMALVTWETNKPATSRVIYGSSNESHIYDSADTIAELPLYGYAHTTQEFHTPPADNGETLHVVAISDLQPETEYFFRVISRASPDTVSEEYSFQTSTPQEPEEETGEGAEAGGTGGPSAPASGTGSDDSGTSIDSVEDEDEGTGEDQEQDGAAEEGGDEEVKEDTQGATTTSPTQAEPAGSGFMQASLIGLFSGDLWLIIGLLILLLFLGLLAPRRRSEEDNGGG